MTLPLLLQKLYPSGLLNVGVSALIASFISIMPGNVAAFNTVWTFDIYQSHIKRNASEKHYLNVSKATAVVGILLNLILDLENIVVIFFSFQYQEKWAMGGTHDGERRYY